MVQHRLIAAPERCGATALICATGQNGEATGDGAAMPMLEDGDFNIDGVDYAEGSTAYSFFGLPGDMKAKAMNSLLGDPDAREGIQWRQCDHALFVQSGCPAIAVISNRLLENMTRQSITHSTQNTMESVDPDKLISCALRLERFITALRQVPHPGETDRNPWHFL